MVTKLKKLTKMKRPQATAFGLVVLVAIGIWLIFFKGSNAGSGVIPSSDTARQAENSGKAAKPNSAVNNTPAASSNDNTKVPVSTPDNNAVLLAPVSTGIVSNHRPSLSGSDEQLQEQSTCTTNAGAQCYIRLTKGSIVKTLAMQTTNSTGTTYWSWNLKDSGLTEGTWTVEAIATLSGQEKITKDGIDLVVNP